MPAGPISFMPAFKGSSILTGQPEVGTRAARLNLGVALSMLAASKEGYSRGSIEM